MELRHKNILLISPEAWGENFVSKHHYAMALSKDNQVYFLNPPSSSFDIIEIKKNLKIVNYKIPIRGINRLPAQVRNIFNAVIIKKIKKKCEIDTFDIIWSFDPYRFQNLNLFKSPFLIYHPVDVHQTRLEQEITRSASIVFTTSDLIRDKLAIYNPNIHNIGHGVAENFLRSNNQRIDRSDTVKICMIGNLHRKIDYSVLFILIELYSYLEFHFIGPYESSNLSNKTLFIDEIKRLKSYSNTYLHGTIDQKYLPDKINEMDIFLILYREDENAATRANPHKILEYLSTGKVILSYYIEEYKNREELLVLVENKKDLILKFKDILHKIAYYNSPEKMKIRKDFARESSYTNILFRIVTLINHHVSENT